MKEYVAIIEQGSWNPCFWNYKFTLALFSTTYVNTKFSNYWMRLGRIWKILQVEEGVIHRGRRPKWITPSEICRFLHILRKKNSIIALLFIQNIFFAQTCKPTRSHFSLCQITQPRPHVFSSMVQSSLTSMGGFGTGCFAHDHEIVFLIPSHLLVEDFGSGVNLVGQESQEWVNSNFWRCKSKKENQFLKKDHLFLRSSLLVRLCIVAFPISQFPSF